MYVMSSLPRHQQSSAGGVFNTVVKLCVTIGLGIATAVFNSVSSNSSGAEYSLKPYRSVFWFSCASAGVSVLLVPFLKIGKQGLKAEDVLEDDNMERNGSSVDVEPKLPAVVESSR
ncbi:hypothetical protein MMC12_003410 [Toensbergia leucococca]|nr:hypothetical protein [Toensbergia leucococca]